MNVNSTKWLTAEIFGIFALFMTLIWIASSGPATIQVGLVLCILVIMLASIKLHGDTTEQMGLGQWTKIEGRVTLILDFSQVKYIAPLTLAAFVLIVCLGIVINPGFWERNNLWERIFAQVKGYPWWAWPQEWLLHGFFTNRIAMAFQYQNEDSDAKAWKIAVTAGVLFAIIHAPNIVLMIGTLILGTISAHFFLKSRNIFVLGIVHALLGTAVKYAIALPLYGSGCMRVGPGFWK